MYILDYKYLFVYIFKWLGLIFYWKCVFNLILLFFIVILKVDIFFVKVVLSGFTIRVIIEEIIVLDY